MACFQFDIGFFTPSYLFPFRDIDGDSLWNIENHTLQCSLLFGLSGEAGFSEIAEAPTKSGQSSHC
jgi:hypothetical protein